MAGRLAVLLAATLSVLGCVHSISAPGIDESVDFRQYRTYAYAAESRFLAPEPGKSGLQAPLANEIARREIDRELSARGWRRVGVTQGGDIVVSFGLGIPPRPTNRNTTPDYPWTGWIKADDRLIVERDFTGRLAIALVDRREDKLVLYGYADEQPAPGADLELVLAQNVAKIMAMLPPR